MIRTPAHKQLDPDKLPGQVMINGLTEEQTNQTASVRGLSAAYKPVHGGYPDAHPFADYQRRAIEQIGQGPSIEVGDTE